MQVFKELAEEIKAADRIMVLTGAGLSVASGIPDFRTSQGAFWLKNQDRTKLMSASYRDSQPKKFWPAFKEIFDIKINNEFDPNYGHIFLKELEDMGKEVTIATQNVDGLHQKAGSSKVYEIHGSMNTATCTKCQAKYDKDYVIQNEIPQCNRLIEKENVCNNYLVVNQFNKNYGFIHCDNCDTKHTLTGEEESIRCKGKKKTKKQCTGYLKPDVVLFGDAIRDFDKAEDAAKKSDLMLVLGTSLQVYPIASLPLSSEGQLAIINLHPTDYDQMADFVIHNDLVSSLIEVKKYL